MSQGVVVTTKDNLRDFVQKDEKEIIIRGKLAETVHKSQKLRKAGVIALFILAISLLVVPCVKLCLLPKIQTFTSDLDDQNYQSHSGSYSNDINRRRNRLTSAYEDNKKENSLNPIETITEYTKKEIISINLGLGLLVILSICSLLHKIISKYDEILFKVDGKVEVHLVHK